MIFWPSGHFRIFNLCEVCRYQFYHMRSFKITDYFIFYQDHEERGNGNYDPALLYNQVQRLALKDHNGPPLHLLISFCENACEWLNADEINIVAIHCQVSVFCSQECRKNDEDSKSCRVERDELVHSVAHWCCGQVFKPNILKLQAYNLHLIVAFQVCLLQSMNP